MANVNNPHGLRPLMRNLAGGPVQANMYNKAAAYAYGIFKWDPVTLLAGVLNGPASGITPGTTNLLGVSLNWSPASTAAEHLVIDAPDALFEAQGDNSGAANVVAAKMGYFANLAAAAGGGVTRDNSGSTISETSINTTNSLDVKILRLLRVPDNAYGGYARLEIKINKHLLNPGVTAT